MKVAITGGTGFDGRHLAERLEGDGHEVVAIGSGRARHGAPTVPADRAVAADITDVAARAIRAGLPDPGGFGLSDLRCASLVFPSHGR